MTNPNNNSPLISQAKTFLVCSIFFEVLKEFDITGNDNLDNLGVSGVSELNHDECLEEVARMLSGSEITFEARAQAKQLMVA